MRTIARVYRANKQNGRTIVGNSDSQSRQTGEVTRANSVIHSTRVARNRKSERERTEWGKRTKTRQREKKLSRAEVIPRERVYIGQSCCCYCFCSVRSTHSSQPRNRNLGIKKKCSTSTKGTQIPLKTSPRGTDTQQRQDMAKTYSNTFTFA